MSRRPTQKQVKALEAEIERFIKERDFQIEQKILALNLKGVVDEANVKLIERVKSLEGQLAQAKEREQVMGNELDTALGEVRGLKDALTIVTRKK